MPELLRIGRAAPVGSRLPPVPDSGPLGPGIGSLDGIRSYRIETWGCQMNEHDSERMAGLLESLGLLPASSEGEADLILLNTCSVREKAAQKVFTRLGQLRPHKRARPHMILGVCGCVAQQEQEAIFARAPFVDLVMGPRRLESLPQLLAASRGRRQAMAVLDPRDRLVQEHAGARRVSRTRAYVTVMEGCNKSCAFCIVPVTRGREACRSAEAILAEVRDCVSAGLIEIELLGQNVNAWRHPSRGGWDFARLLGAVATVEGVRRVRFTTSHPLHFNDSIIEAMVSHATICHHLHLPAQSGADGVLRRMRRGYTVADYLDRVERLRQRIPDIALSTDIIVGFPGESNEDFEKTLELVERANFHSMFSFVYSKRPGTPAADYQDSVDASQKKKRLHRLQSLHETMRATQLQSMVGKVVEVLVDGPAARGAGHVAGRTSQNDLVNLPGTPSLVGHLVNVRIERASAHSLVGNQETGLTSTPPRHKDEVELRN